MKKVTFLVLALALSAGLLGCSSNDGEQALEKGKSEVKEVDQKTDKLENNEEKPQKKADKEKQNADSESSETTGNKEEGGRKQQGGGDGTGKKLSQEKLEEIIKQLDKKVEDGELASEERDKLVEEIRNGNLRSIKEILEN
ncbi:hypothetical protein R9X47_08160 [Wukongibacter baidiensis]|uniref:hypothetical protein n=1 Tax=Wukongibacter baidiensis TaxID=1723361 RepID=UPI003D7F8B6A